MALDQNGSMSILAREVVFVSSLKVLFQQIHPHIAHF